MRVRRLVSYLLCFLHFAGISHLILSPSLLQVIQLRRLLLAELELAVVGADDTLEDQGGYPVHDFIAVRGDIIEHPQLVDVVWIVLLELELIFTIFVSFGHRQC